MNGFSIKDIESTEEERAEFDKWFRGIVLDWEKNKSCFWRDVIRHNRANMFKTYLAMIRNEI